MAGIIYFSFLFCLLTNPLMNVLWARFYGLKIGWILVLSFIFIVSCVVFLSGIEDIVKEINKLRISNENRIRKTVELEREIDELKKEIEELKINN